jgi:glycosyltransferase involved in cell wall biosynthesis
VADKFTTVIVDDGSSDNSLQSISDLPVKILKHSTNFGQGAALQTGFEFAKKNPNLEIFVTFDADGQHQIKDIENIISPIKENKADIVFGTRFQDDKTKMPFLKRIILKLAIRYTNLSTGVPLTDAHNGFRAMNRTALSEMQLNLNGMAHATEIVAIAHKANLRIAETPVEILYTKYSKAKGQSILNSINILSDLFLR